MAAIATKHTRLGLDLKGGVELVYQAKPTAQSKVNAESLERAINIMRYRVDKIGVSEPEIQRSGKEEIDVALPAVHNIKQAEEEVGTTAQLNFYDWETERHRPQRQDRSQQRRGHGRLHQLGRGRRVRRADRVPGRAAGLQTPADPAQQPTPPGPPGCTPEQKNDCIYGTWFLLDTAHEAVCAAPKKPKAR